MKISQQPLRILHLTNIYCGIGVAEVLMNYARHLPCGKVVFDFAVQENLQGRATHQKEIESLGGKVWVLPNRTKNLMEYYRKLYQLIKEQNYAVVHGHESLYSYPALLAAKWAGTSVRILHAHGTGENAVFWDTLVKGMHPFLPLFCTHYMACGMKAGLVQFGEKIVNGPNYDWMPNGLSLIQYHYTDKMREQKRDELKVPTDAWVVGHVARLSSVKNQKYLLRLFQKIHQEKQNSCLLIVGDGPLQEELETEIVRLGLHDCVRLLGRRDDIPQLLQVFDVFALPSLREGFPVSLVEAQAAGLPCVVAQDNVTQQVDFTGLVQFIPLDDENRWVQALLQPPNFARGEFVLSTTFEIEQNAQWLSERYWALIGEVPK